MTFTAHDDDEPGPESPPFDSTHKDECADGIINDDRDIFFTSSDTGNADDSIDEPLSNHCFDEWQTDGGVVECLPDYIVYRDKYSTDSVVTFSSSCIKIEGYWQAENFEFQWGVDHIMNIECQWCERLELATVIIRVNSKGTAPTEDVHGHTGFEEFKFAIVEDWYRKQDEIMSLDVYQPLWNIVLSSDMERDAKVLPGQSKMFPLKHYFPSYHWSLIVICHPGEVADFQDSDARKTLKLPCILHMDSIRGSHSGLKRLIQSYLWEEWKERQADSSEDIFLKFSNMRFFSLELPQQQNLYDCGLFLLHYVELFLEGNLVNFNPLKISSFSNFLTANWFQPAEASLKRAYIQRLIYDMLDDGSSEPCPSNGEDEKCTSMYPKSVDKDRTASEFLSDGSSFSKVVHESVPCSQDGQGLELSLLHSSLADSIQSANDSGFILRGPGEAEAAVESLCRAFERTRAEAAVEFFCQAFDQTAPSEEFKNGSESIQPVNDFGFVSRGPAKAEAAVESCCQDFEQKGHSECSNAMPPIEMGFVSRRPAAAESFGQAFEQTAPSEESRNVSENIQPINGSSFVSRGLPKAEPFCQAFEQTAPSKEFRNVSESIQPVNGSSFISRGLAKAEVAVESFSQDFEPPSGCSNVMPPIEQEDKSYEHSRCSPLGTTGFQEPKTSTSEACVAYLSKESGAEPLWDRESNTCQNVLVDTDSSKESICASDDFLKSENAIHSKIGTNLSMEVKLDHHQPKFSSLGNLDLFVDLRMPSSSDHMLNGNNTLSKNCGSPPRNCDALEDRSAACAPGQCICDGLGTGVQQATKKRRLAPIKEGPSSDEDLHE